MRTISKLLLPLLPHWWPARRTPTSADLRAIHQQSQSHFDGWKKDGPDSVMKGDKRGPVYLSNFMLDGAKAAPSADNSTVYTCIWRYATPAEMGRAYQRLVNDVKACAPLAKEPPASSPTSRRNAARATCARSPKSPGWTMPMRRDGADRTDAADRSRGVARNELKLSFSRPQPR
jgi:hypothetical protein